MGKTPGWQLWEHDVQRGLGLDATICSGNQWHDQGDAVDNDHTSPWPMFVDCKYTESRDSFSVGAKFFQQMSDKATAVGKRFLLAVRFGDTAKVNRPYFEHKGNPAPDVVVVLLEDYLELLEFYREGHQQ